MAITDLSFSPEFTSAIERKQIAQQEAEKAKYIVARTEQERLAVVIRVRTLLVIVTLLWVYLI